MSARTCEMDDCDRPHYGRGLCKPHHNSWRRAERRPMPPCSQEGGCHRLATGAHGLCATHRKEQVEAEAEHKARPDWFDDAACRGKDPRLFVSEPGPGVRHKVHYAEALEICSTCPVRQECLDQAMREPLSVPGIYGGTTESEREQLRKERKRAA